MIRLDPNKSIFIQLADYLRGEIYSGRRKAGEKLESIRDMAVVLQVNSNTVRRVYEELEKEKLIYTDSTLGKFVTKDEKVIASCREIYISRLAALYVTEARQAGAKDEDVIAEVLLQLKEAGHDDGHTLD